MMEPAITIGAFSPSSMFKWNRDRDRDQDPNRDRGFFPQDIVWAIRVTELPGITQGKKALYDRIARWYQWKPGSYPAQAQLAKELGICERQVRDDQDWLQAEGFIALTEDPEKRRRTWKLLWHPLFAKSGTTAPVSGRRKSGSRVPVSASVAVPNRLQKPELILQKPELGGTKTGTPVPHNPINPDNPRDETSTTSAASSVVCSNGVKPSEDDAGEAAYVDQVRRLYLASPIVAGKFNALDQNLAKDLSRYGVPLDRVHHAILLGSARKMKANTNNGDRSERIMSLKSRARNDFGRILETRRDMVEEVSQAGTETTGANGKPREHAGSGNGRSGRAAIGID